MEITRCSTGAIALLVIAALGRPAAADVYCGASNPYVDVPHGNLVTSQSQNTIITPIVTGALGETRTHSMLMTNDLFMHAAMKTPQVRDNAPWLSGDQLKWGDPGASQIDIASAYTYLYHPGNGGLAWLSQQWPGSPYETNDGVRVADWVWYSMPYRWVGARCETMLVKAGSAYYDCEGQRRTAPSLWLQSYVSVNARTGGGYYRLQQSWGGDDITYRLNQFADLKRVNQGDLGELFCNNQGCVNQDGPGAVCSTLIAYAVHKAVPTRAVAPYSYPADVTANAVTALANKVYSDCRNGLDWWQKGICWLPGVSSCNDACTQASNQVVRCFLSKDDCWASGSYYLPPGTRANSISPDTLAGWRPGQDWNNPPINSPWAPFDPVSVNFSGGGTTYSCWTGG